MSRFDDGGLHSRAVGQGVRENGQRTLVNDFNSLLLLSSADRGPGESVNSVNFSKSRFFGTSLIKSVALKQFEWPYFTPNLNVRNNTFYLNDGMTTYAITVPEGSYSFATFPVHLQAVIQAIPALSAYTVSLVDLSTAPIPTFAEEARRFLISSNGGTFSVFSPSVQSEFVFGISRIPSVAATTFTTMATTLLYSSFYDVCCRDIHEYTFRDESSSLGTSAVLVRLPIRFTDNDNLSNFVAHLSAFQNLKKIRFDSEASISNLQIQIFDQFGDLYYVPDYGNNVLWSCVLETFNNYD